MKNPLLELGPEALARLDEMRLPSVEELNARATGETRDGKHGSSHIDVVIRALELFADNVDHRLSARQGSHLQLHVFEAREAATEKIILMVRSRPPELSNETWSAAREAIGLLERLSECIGSTYDWNATEAALRELKAFIPGLQLLSLESSHVSQARTVQSSAAPKSHSPDYSRQTDTEELAGYLQCCRTTARGRLAEAIVEIAGRECICIDFNKVKAEYLHALEPLRISNPNKLEQTGEIPPNFASPTPARSLNDWREDTHTRSRC